MNPIITKANNLLNNIPDTFYDATLLRTAIANESHDAIIDEVRSIQHQIIENKSIKDNARETYLSLIMSFLSQEHIAYDCVDISKLSYQKLFCLKQFLYCDLPLDYNGKDMYSSYLMQHLAASIYFFNNKKINIPLRQKLCCFAFHYGVIVGWCLLDLEWQNINKQIADVGEINILVHPKFRSQGIGKNLVQMAIDEAKILNLSKIIGHKNGTSLYSKFGFNININSNSDYLEKVL